MGTTSVEKASEDKTSKREDLDHKAENAGKVGSQLKQANQGGEAPRSRSSEDEEKPV